jgi:hypothetical protein
MNGVDFFILFMLFYFIYVTLFYLCYFILFYFILFYFILFYFILFYFIFTKDTWCTEAWSIALIEGAALAAEVIIQTNFKPGAKKFSKKITKF